MRLLLAAKQMITNAGAVSVDKSLPLRLFQDTYHLDGDATLLLWFSYVKKGSSGLGHEASWLLVSVSSKKKIPIIQEKWSLCWQASASWSVDWRVAQLLWDPCAPLWNGYGWGPKGHFLQHGWPAAMRGGSPPSFLDLGRCDLRCKLFHQTSI